MTTSDRPYYLAQTAVGNVTERISSLMGCVWERLPGKNDSLVIVVARTTTLPQGGNQGCEHFGTAGV